MIEEIVVGGVVLLLLNLAYRKFGRPQDADDGSAQGASQERQASAHPPDEGRPLTEGYRLRFAYVDREGRASLRLVTPKQLDVAFTSDGESAILGFVGFCHDRRALRNFRVEGMKNAYVFETAEGLAGVADIQRWLAEKLPLPPAPPRARRGQADGAHTAPKERRVIPHTQDQGSAAPEGDRVRFGYVDGDGRQSIRLVTPTQLDFYYAHSGERVIAGFSGYCHDRRATRTFLTERMQKAYVFDTGEVLEDAAAIERWLLEELPTPSGRRRRKPRTKPKPQNVPE